MTPAWILVSVVLPPLSAVLATIFLRPRAPGPYLVTGLNAILPGSGLAAVGRPTLEVVLGVLFAQVSLLISGSVHELWMYVPCMVVGGIWGLLYTALNPLTRAADSEKERLRRQIQESDSLASPT